MGMTSHSIHISLKDAGVEPAAFLVPYLHTTLPASAATVTLTPVQQHISTDYVVTAATGTPDVSQNQVSARLLSSTLKESVTVKATGKGHQDATNAKGKLSIRPIMGTLSVGFYYLTGGDLKVDIGFNVKTPLTSDTTVDAQALLRGPVGNISAYGIDGYYDFGKGIVIYAQNPQPFTGGQDAYDYTFVQQSDIDGAATPLVSKLTADVQSAVQKQMQAHEQLVNDVQVTSKVSSNHKANDRVGNVTVSASVASKAEAYKPQEVQSMAVNQHKNGTATRLGTDYVLVGDVVTAPPVVMSSLDDGTVMFLVKTQGVWVYHFSDAQLQSMAQAITGKTEADAITLLAKQKGVQKNSLTTSGGWGTALPTTPGDVKFKVVNVPGLQALPTS